MNWQLAADLNRLLNAKATSTYYVEYLEAALRHSTEEHYREVLRQEIEDARKLAAAFEDAEQQARKARIADMGREPA